MLSWKAGAVTGLVKGYRLNLNETSAKRLIM